MLFADLGVRRVTAGDLARPVAFNVVAFHLINTEP